jgi:N-methylhydantoinase A
VSARVGIDVGGTFTDFVVNVVGSAPFAWKTPTTRPDPSAGIFQGLEELIRQGKVRADEIEEVSVGTTIALNAILSRTGVLTALITTRGFRDVLEIGRENRRGLYDLQQEKLPVLVPRRLRVEVDERVTWRGEIVRPLRMAEVRERLDALAGQGVRSLAVCLLHCYANPEHERLIKELVLAEYPEISVSVSHEVMRHYREYERTLITVLNAYVKPAMQSYVEGFTAGVGRLSPRASVFLAHSGGGVMGPSAAGERAVHSALSGPAAGVGGSTLVCAAAGVSNFITMDMGGTSCDVALVEGGQPGMGQQANLGGYLVGLRTVDVTSISAGGGTVAWVDAGGLLRVGPRSAGSTPGPACYGRGGREPTITDAHLVLGHIDPVNVLGGSIRLDRDAARRSIESRICRPLGVDLTTAAAGVLRIADAAMVRALEVVSIERGHDPRELALVAFGGAAPIHAGTVAEDLGIERVLVPRQAGVLCALGTLSCDEQYELHRTVLRPTEEVDLETLARELADIVEEAKGLVDPRRRGAARFQLSLDMRYRGQTFSLEIGLPVPPRTRGDLARVHGEFERRYRATFGYTVEGNPSEIEKVRVLATVPRPPPELERLGRGAAERRPPRRWRAHFDRRGLVDCLIHDVTCLGAGEAVSGPAVINTVGSTTLVGPGQEAALDDFGNLLIQVRPRDVPG